MSAQDKWKVIQSALGTVTDGIPGKNDAVALERLESEALAEYHARKGGAFNETKAKVFNRGVPPDAFLRELVGWARQAPDEIFAPNDNPGDIYAAITPELGSFGADNLPARKAAMLEVMRVLAGFESSWDWNEGVDTTRVAADTDENAEAGAWQVSADSLAFGADLKALVRARVGNPTGVAFQRAMKSDHALAMEYVARLMRHTTRHNGPLYRDRSKIKAALRGPEHSIYPWLRRSSAAEFEQMLRTT